MSLSLQKPNISLVMPAYNEAENIASVISNAVAELLTFSEKYEIIVVNDGSRDQTGEILQQLIKSNPCIRLIQHSKNLGYGAAVRSGLKETRLDFVFLTDADGQFDFKELPQVFRQLAISDFVMGYRINRQDSLNRKINAYLWNRLCQLLFRTGVRDADCAFKLFKRPILDSFELKANGAMISVELIVKTRKAGFKITQTAVHHYPRLSGNASGANLRVIFRAFKELYQLYPELH